MSDGQALRLRVGRRVKALANRSGLSIDTLAARAKLSADRVEEIVRGTSDCITLREMALLADTLTTPVADLLAPCRAAGIIPLEEVEKGGTRHA